MMNPLNRLRSALRHLAKADRFREWKLSRGRCPNCSGSWFLSLRPDAFMTRCLSCKANVTNLSLIPVIQMHGATHRIDSAWEMSTYGATLAWLRRHVQRVQTSEFFPEAAPGAFVDGVLNQDVQRLSFANDAFDLITSSQVFEHVRDDMQGYRECFRVLKPAGALVFSVPLYDIPVTEQLATVANGALVHLCAPEYHDSRHGGPASALCFWRHSVHDIAARVSAAGFDTQLVPVRIPETLRDPTMVIYAQKPAH